MRQMLTLVLASGNPGKLVELRALLAGLPVELKSLAEVLGREERLREDSATFEANAAQKARAACELSQLCAVADDSGLEVRALAGRPGVRSARFAHERATDGENNAALLRQLEEVSEGERQAQFRCVLALVTPWAPEQVSFSEGVCTGIVARTPRGSGGFGYDPLFIVSEFPERSMAELTEAEKNSVSHRGRAVAGLRPLLLELLQRQVAETERICR
jgi:XTP/dITP diphosphohydrolase